MGEKLRKILADWQKEREEAAAWLAGLTNEQLDRKSQPVTLAKIGQFTDYTLPEMTVRQLMNRISDHHRDHQQHLLRARRTLGCPRTDAQRIVAEMQAVRAELAACLQGLPDDVLDKTGWEEGEWSIRQILEHLAEWENTRLTQVKQALGATQSK